MANNSTFNSTVGTNMPSILEEELMDFESAAAHFALGADECWGLTELDEEALLRSSSTSSSGNNSGSRNSLKVTSSSSTTRVSSTMKIESSDNCADTTDIFGCVRFGNNGFGGNKGRPTMISAKYRLKEERRKVLKISINKLKRIEDPESSLCRSVLINNTMKRLQREAREEKLQRQGIYQPQITLFENELSKTTTTEEVITTTTPEPARTISPSPPPSPPPPSRKRSASTECEDCDVQDVLSHFYMPPTPRLLTSIDEEEEENHVPIKKQCTEQLPSSDTPSNINNNNNNKLELQTPATLERLKSHQEQEQTDICVVDLPAIHERLSSSSDNDDDEEIDVVNESNSTFDTTDFTKLQENIIMDTTENRINNVDFCDNSSKYPPSSLSHENKRSLLPSTNNNNNCQASSGNIPSSPSSVLDSNEQQHFSCGHSSIFGELQSVVFHSLIASLES